MLIIQEEWNQKHNDQTMTQRKKVSRKHRRHNKSSLQ